MELDTALLRQIEKSILLDTVYDERKISEQAMQPLPVQMSATKSSLGAAAASTSSRAAWMARATDA